MQDMEETNNNSNYTFSINNHNGGIVNITIGDSGKADGKGITLEMPLHDTLTNSSITEAICPTGMEAVRGELIRKYDHFVDTVRGGVGGMDYGFFELEKVAALSTSQQGRLISKIVERADNRGAYAIAMLCFLGYHTQMQERYLAATHNRLTKETLAEHWMEALGLKSKRHVMGNYRLCVDPNSQEDKDIYKAWSFELAVKDDYNEILHT